MSPFANFLHTSRMKRGVRQTELAERMGYEQTYISALEMGKKGPPSEDFVNSLIEALDLTEEECNQLAEAIEASQRKLVLNTEDHQEVYWMIKELRDRLPELTTTQIQLIRQILSIKETMFQRPTESMRQLKRRRNQEVKM